jgi:hypothetical protein
MFHVARISQMGVYICIFKRTTNALGYINVILLHGDHQRVSANHVTNPQGLIYLYSCSRYPEYGHINGRDISVIIL